MLEDLTTFARQRALRSLRLYTAQEFPMPLFLAMGESGLLSAAGCAEAACGQAILTAESGSLGFAAAWAVQVLTPLALEHFAGLPAPLRGGLADGTVRLALAVSEPQRGAHPKYLRTAARPVPGGWLLNGEKTFVTNGPQATHLALIAVTAEEAGRKQCSCFLVPTETPGLARVDLPPLDFYLPAQHCGFRLQDCFVPAEALLGPAGAAFSGLALPFRSLEDATSAGSLAAAVHFCAQSLAQRQSADCDADTAALLGELAAIETATQALLPPLLQALAAWTAGSQDAGLHLAAVHSLTRQALELLRRLPRQDEDSQRWLHDLEKSFSIARSARTARLGQLGRAYYQNENL